MFKKHRCNAVCLKSSAVDNKESKSRIKDYAFRIVSNGMA